MLQFGNDLIDSLIHSNVKFNSIFPSGSFKPYTQGCQSTSTTNTLQLPVVDSGLPLVCVVPENRGVMIGDETMGL